MNNGDILKAAADAKGIPLRTLADVRADLEAARKNKTDVTLARMLINHGRLTDEARAFVRAWK